MVGLGSSPSGVLLPACYIDEGIGASPWVRVFHAPWHRTHRLCSRLAAGILSADRLCVREDVL